MIDPDLKRDFFNAFTDCVEGCAPDALQSMKESVQAFKDCVWTVAMQKDHLLEGFTITSEADPVLVANWELMDWDSRRVLLDEWVEGYAHPIE